MDSDSSSQLPTTPDEALTKIQSFLDFSISDPSNSRVVQSFRQHYTEYIKANNLSWNLIGYLYEQLMFLRGDDITPPTGEDICQSRFFRPNVNFSLEGVTEPTGIQIHVFTTSDSKELHLDDVSSMVLELSMPHDNRFEDAPKMTLDFLNKLFTTRFKNLKNLKLSGFRVTRWLWESLSKFQLDWLHITCPFSPFGREYFYCSFPESKRLHLKLEETFDLGRFPCLPTSLEELSLHFSNLESHDSTVEIHGCKSLEKM